MTDPAGRPIAMRVLAGNTADPAAFITAVEVVRTRFGLTDLVMIGDRGMITSARIAALRKDTDLGWLTALRAPRVAALAADDGPLQLSLFDQVDLAEITHPDYPGERLIACRNPALASERARKRAALLAATDAALVPIAAAVTAGRLVGADRIGVKVGKTIDRYKMAKHLHLTITDTTLTITATRPASTPRPPWTESTCCAPACPPHSWTRADRREATPLAADAGWPAAPGRGSPIPATSTLVPWGC